MRYPIPGVLAVLLALTLGACQQYEVTVNERRVYTPEPLFTDFTVPDPALRACLESTISREKITSANQLQALTCREAGIVQLTGLGTFNNLRYLDLAGNRIGDIAELAQLTPLEEVVLADNPIVDPLPLVDLPALDSVDLRGNNSLLCPSRDALLRVHRVQLPSHCGR